MTYENLVSDLRYQLKTTQDEFETFRLKNDLDILFGQSLDFDKRREILSSIRELMQESDWHKYTRDEVDSKAAAQTKTHLEVII